MRLVTHPPEIDLCACSHQLLLAKQLSAFATHSIKSLSHFRVQITVRLVWERAGGRERGEREGGGRDIRGEGDKGRGVKRECNAMQKIREHTTIKK